VNGSTDLTVTRRETFSSAHQLFDPLLTAEENARTFGKCASLHGHNYTLEVTVSGSIDPNTGYIVDLTALAEVLRREILDHVDHRNLNTDVEWLAGQQPTAEVLAAAFFERLRPHLPDVHLRKVRVWETEKNSAECRGG
jgi:6-pyruvoyltetrahydropterin/6-carboxytetrahydropterin synthase